MALPGSARTELHEIIVSLDERDHSQQDNSFGPFTESACFKPNRAQQKIDPFGSAEAATCFRVYVEYIRLRHLDRAKRIYLERSSALFLSDDAVVGQRNLGIKAVGQHSLIFAHKLIVDANIPQSQAGQLRDIAVVLRIEPRANDINNPD